MDVITTTLEREWFAKIAAGRKRVEYREIKPYWTKRLNGVRVPFKLVLRNGMNPPVPVLTVRIDRVQPNPPHHRWAVHRTHHEGRALGPKEVPTAIGLSEIVAPIRTGIEGKGPSRSQLVAGE